MLLLVIEDIGLVGRCVDLGIVCFVFFLRQRRYDTKGTPSLIKKEHGDIEGCNIPTFSVSAQIRRNNPGADTCEDCRTRDTVESERTYPVCATL